MEGMEYTDSSRYAGSKDSGNSDSDSGSSSTDLGHHTITHSSESYDITTSPATEATTGQDNRSRKNVAERDDDDTSSSDSSEEDGDVVTNNANKDGNTNSQVDKSATEIPNQQSSAEEIVPRPSSVTNDKTHVAKKEATRLSARLGHMSIVDSVVVRKKVKDRISENELYNEISKLVTEDTDDIGGEHEDKPQGQTNNEETNAPLHTPTHDDDATSKSEDGNQKSETSVPPDEPDQEDVPTSYTSAKVKVSHQEDVPTSHTSAKVKVSQEVSQKLNRDSTIEMEEVELDNFVEDKDDTLPDDSTHRGLSTCCCFRVARKS